MISVIRKNHMASLPLGKGSPIWACRSSWTAVVIGILNNFLTGEPGSVSRVVAAPGSLRCSARRPLSPKRIQYSIQHEKSKERGQINERAAQYAARLPKRMIAPEAGGADYKIQAE